jgi:hypothetical protein
LLSRTGTEYEYTIQVVNDILSPVDLEDLRKMETAADARAAENARASLKKDEVWKQDPPSQGYDRTVTSYAGNAACGFLPYDCICWSFTICPCVCACVEIVSASGFESSKLFVHYQIVVPHGWNLRTGNVVDGMAEEDIKAVTKKGTAEQRRLAKEALEHDGFEDGEEAMGALNGATQCANAKEWRCGHPYHASIPRRSWTVIPFTFDEGTRLVIGWAFFIITIMSICLVSCLAANT